MLSPTKLAYQRRWRANRRVLLAKAERVACACGCGSMLSPRHPHKKEVAPRYKPGHNKSTLGRRWSATSIAKRAETRRARNGGLYQTKRGWKHRPETIAKMTVAVRRRDLAGVNNPFYGKRHPPELLRRIAEKNSGPGNAGWRGGVSVLPYGPGFTRKTKRIILERDGYRCRRCGKQQSELKRGLQVHHLDHDKNNNDHSNLAAACGSCNVWASYHRAESFITGGVPLAG